MRPKNRNTDLFNLQLGRQRIEPLCWVPAQEVSAARLLAFSASLASNYNSQGTPRINRSLGLIGESGGRSEAGPEPTT